MKISSRITLVLTLITQWLLVVSIHFSIKSCACMYEALGAELPAITAMTFKIWDTYIGQIIGLVSSLTLIICEIKISTEKTRFFLQFLFLFVWTLLVCLFLQALYLPALYGGRG